MNDRRKGKAIVKHFTEATERYEEGDIAGGDQARAKGKRAMKETYGRKPARKVAGNGKS